jgi:NAD(P)-dependent dehydrogenase (short-subunit alcohol dehydrogenase family)
VLAFAVDVADESSVEAAFGDLVDAWGAIDGLVNNAGITKVAPALDFDLSDWRRILETNVTGVFICARAAARHMLAAGRGSIVNIASLSSFIGQPERAAYVSSKTAVLGMTKSLAVEWGPLGVRVNAIAPGYIETDLVTDLLDRGVLQRDVVEGRTPLRRFGTPDDLVGAALFLLGDRSAFATGQALSIDGGWLANGYLR